MCVCEADKQASGDESHLGSFSGVGRPIKKEVEINQGRSEWQGEQGAMRGVWKLRIRLR